LAKRLIVSVAQAPVSQMPALASHAAGTMPRAPSEINLKSERFPLTLAADD